jgi:multidrug efflux pump subunit AcrB
VASKLEKIPDFIDFRSETSIGKRDVHVIVDRERSKKMDFTPQEIARNIEVAMRGVNLRRIQGKEGEIMVRVEFQKEEKRTLNHLRDLTIFQTINL